MNVYYDKQLEAEQTWAGSLRTHPPTAFCLNDDSQTLTTLTPPLVSYFSDQGCLPPARDEAAKTFYHLLDWINGEESIFKSDDGLFQLLENRDRSDAAITETGFCAFGRLTLFYRDNVLNLFERAFSVLGDTLWGKLAEIDPDFEFGKIGFVNSPCTFINLPFPLSHEPGKMLILYFDAWGTTEKEMTINVNCLLRNLRSALESCQAEIARENSDLEKGKILPKGF